MHLNNILLGLLVLLVPQHAYPAVIRVPGEYQVIQSAVDAAGDGDTILIADGTYTGQGNINIQWDGRVKHLVIMSEHGRDYCIIDCQEEGRGFLLNMGQDQRDVIEGITITRGMVLGAGGAILINSASPVLRNCTFINNTATGYHDNSYSGCGGAVIVLNASFPLIQGNIIRDNIASNLGGGVLFADYSGGILESNIIDGNEALDHWGGGIALWNNSNPPIINNLIINNSCSGFNGGRGGGIYLDHSDSRIVNNTIAFNYTTGDEYGDGFGGGICIGDWAAPVIRNCIIWHNFSGAASMNIYFDPREWLDISYCNVEGDLDHIYELKPYTNMDVPPEFTAPEEGDFHLSLKSPCINRGIPDTTGLSLPSLDLSGDLRIFLDTVDMGAYELNSPAGNPWESNEGDFLLYPNPSAGISFLELKTVSAPDDLELKIYNARGELVAEEHPDGAKAAISIDLSSEAEGIYFLSVMSGGRVLYRQKLIKK